MARIVCEADPFCYGPASTLLTVIRELHSYGHSVAAVACGTAYELISRVPHVDVVRCDTTSSAELRAALRSLGPADLFLSVLGDAGVHVAQEIGVPVAYIDVLFWIWPSTSQPHIRDVELYFIENHFDAATMLTELNSPPVNPVLVAPIVDTTLLQGLSHTRRKHSHILVTFGGAESPATPTPAYPLIMSTLLIEVLRCSLETREVVVTSGAATIDRLRLSCAAPSVRYESLSHDEFLTTLQDSELLLTQPGLATPLEAFAHQVPAIFLPPMNYTQVLQLTRFAAAGAAPYAIGWDTLDRKRRIPTDLTESEGIAQVLARVARLATDGAWQARVRDRIAEYLSLPVAALEALQGAQTTFWRGIPKHGSVMVADAINNYLVHRT